MGDLPFTRLSKRVVDRSSRIAHAVLRKENQQAELLNDMERDVLRDLDLASTYTLLRETERQQLVLKVSDRYIGEVICKPYSIDHRLTHEPFDFDK